MLDAAGTAQTETLVRFYRLFGLLFAATGFVGSLQAALDRIWEAPPPPGGVWALSGLQLKFSVHTGTL